MKTPKDEIKDLLDNGHTQVELAKIAGVTQMTISRWARGETERIDVKSMDRIRWFAAKQAGIKFKKGPPS